MRIAREQGRSLPFLVTHRTCARHSLLVVPQQPRMRRFVVRRMGHGRFYVYDRELGYEPERDGVDEDGVLVIVTYTYRADAEKAALEWERLVGRSRVMSATEPLWRQQYYPRPEDGER